MQLLQSYDTDSRESGEFDCKLQNAIDMDTGARGMEGKLEWQMQGSGWKSVPQQQLSSP